MSFFQPQIHCVLEVQINSASYCVAFGCYMSLACPVEGIILTDIVCVSDARAVFHIEALFLKIFGRIADSQPAPMGLIILF